MGHEADGRTVPGLRRRYVSLKRQGRRGLLDVYRAVDVRCGRSVWVTVIPASGMADGECLERFADEVRALARVASPHVTPVLDLGRSGEVAYAVAPAVDGEPITAWARRRSAGLAEIAGVAAQAADGLAEAHEAGVLHRDLSPDRVLVSEEGFAKVVDFGLGRFAGGEHAVPTTGSGYLVGSSPYTAPELLSGGRSSAASDLFSLAAVVHRVVADVHGSTDVDDELAAILRRGFAQQPQDRHASVRAFGDALRGWLEGARAEGVEAVELPAPVPLPLSGGSRNPGPSGLTTPVLPALGVLLLGLAAGVLAGSAGAHAGAAGAPASSSSSPSSPRSTVPGTRTPPPLPDALSRAAAAGRPDEVKRLLAGGARVDTRGPGGRTALHEAAVSGSLNAVRFLLDAGASVDEPDDEGCRALYLATAAGREAVVEALLDARAAVDGVTSAAARPLHAAAAAGWTSLVRRLVRAGADPAAPDSRGRSPLHAACAAGAVDAALLLRSLGVTDAPDAEGARPTDLARINGYPRLAEALTAESH